MQLEFLIEVLLLRTILYSKVSTSTRTVSLVKTKVVYHVEAVRVVSREQIF